MNEAKLRKFMYYAALIFIGVTGLLTLFGPNFYFWRTRNAQYTEDPATTTYMASVFSRIKTGRFEELRGEFETGLEHFDEGFAQTKAFFEANPLKEEKLVQFSIRKWEATAPDGRKIPLRQSVFMYDALFPDRNGMIFVRVNENDGAIRLHTINFSELTKPYNETVRENVALFGQKRIFSTLAALFFLIALIATELDYHKLVKNPRIWIMVTLPMTILLEIVSGPAGLAWSWQTFSFLPVVNRGFNILGECNFGISLPPVLILYWLWLRRREIKRDAREAEQSA